MPLFNIDLKDILSIDNINLLYDIGHVKYGK